jgi:two-component system, OmpR family, alkaline phosphatase synthesis response regulator PhoP
LHAPAPRCETQRRESRRGFAPARGGRRTMRRKRILIIDDDVELLEELEEVLSQGGYEVIAFSDGESALEAPGTPRPYAILLDLRMRGKSGFQVSDELRRTAWGKDVPIIAMSAHFLEREYRLLMTVCGINGFLGKPFEPIDLFEAIESCVTRVDESTLENEGGTA